MSNNNSQGASVAKSSGIVAFGTLCSRFLGFIRDMVLAHFMGTGFLADAFFVAQRIPNLFRDMVGEGAANAAIVPVVTHYYHQKSPKEWLRLINVVMAWSVMVLGCITIVGIVAAPWIVKLMAPGFTHEPEKLELTVNLTRIMFPYLILIALTAIQVGILYSLRSFAVPAFGPCLLNVAMILGAWACASFNWSLAYGLAISVLIGGIWQFLAQYQKLKKLGVTWCCLEGLKHPGAVEIGKLMVPRLWGSAVYQINIFVDTFCASLAHIVGAGGISAIYYANRLVQFPLGVFGYALASVSLSSLSNHAAKGEMHEFNSSLSTVLRHLGFILIPSSVLMIVLAKPLVETIFMRGAFDSQSAAITTSALVFALIGLPFYGWTRILVTGCYALKDTKTPVKIATVCLLVNILGNVLLMHPLKIGGIALASSISGILNVALLLIALNRNGNNLTRELCVSTLRLIPALITMMIAVFITLRLNISNQFFNLIIVLTAAKVSYMLVCFLTQVPEAKSIIALIRRKLMLNGR